MTKTYRFHAQGKDWEITLSWDARGNTTTRIGNSILPVALERLGTTVMRLSLGKMQFLFDMHATPQGLRIVHEGQRVLLGEPQNLRTASFPAARIGSKILHVKSQIPGMISSVQAREGQWVKEGETLVIIEAMKMQNPVRAPKSGKIEKIHVVAGAIVACDASLLDLTLGDKP